MSIDSFVLKETWNDGYTTRLGELIPLLMNYREMLEQANARAWSIGGRESAKLREFYSSELKKLDEVLE
jgi:hypothetical protein